MPVAESKQPQSTSKSTKSKFVEFDEFIDFQLRKTRKGIHSADLMSSGVILAAFLLGYLSLFSIFDHWVIPGGFNDLTRLILFAIVGVVSVGWLVVKIAIPLLREVNVLYAAKEIEQAHPELKSSLVSWVQLHEQGQKIPPDIMRVLEKQTALGVKKADVDEAVDRRLLMRSSYVLLGIVVFMCLYTIFSPKKLSSSVWRALFPNTAVAASTRTEILKVVPGDYEVLARDHLDVIVDLAGVIPEDVTLEFTTSDRRFVDEPVTMQNTGEGLPRFRARLTGVNGEGLLKDFTYRIEAGDAVSETYQVRINQPPSAEVTSIEYDYPDYMLLEDTIQQSSSIDAWVGTYVTVRAKTNMPIRWAKLYRSDNDSGDETADFIEMTKTGPDEVEARWRLKMRSDGTFPGHYFIQVQNEEEQVDPQPTIHRMVIRPDQPPEVTLIHPTTDLEVPANAVVPIAYEARDPDFQIRRVVLKLERDGELLPSSPRLFDGPESAVVRSKYQLELEPLRLSPGDELTFYVEAEDNFVPFDDLPKNVSAAWPKIKLTIIEPVSEEEQQQFTDQQEQEIRDKIQEANGDRREERPDQPQQGEQRDPREEGDPDQNNTDETQEGSQQPQNEDQSQDGNESRQQKDGEGTDDSESTNTNGTGEQRQPSDTQEQTTNEQSASDSDSNSTDESNQRDPANDDTTNSQQNGNQSDQTQQQNSSDSSNQDQNQANENRNDPSRDSEDQNNSQQRQRKAQDDEALRDLLKWSEDQKDEPQDSNDTPDQQPQERSAENSQQDNSEQNQSESNQQRGSDPMGQSSQNPATDEQSSENRDNSASDPQSRNKTPRENPQQTPKQYDPAPENPTESPMQNTPNDPGATEPPSPESQQDPSQPETENQRRQSSDDPNAQSQERPESDPMNQSDQSDPQQSQQDRNEEMNSDPMNSSSDQQADSQQSSNQNSDQQQDPMPSDKQNSSDQNSSEQQSDQSKGTSEQQPSDQQNQNDQSQQADQNQNSNSENNQSQQSQQQPSDSTQQDPMQSSSNQQSDTQQSSDQNSKQQQNSDQSSQQQSNQQQNQQTQPTGQQQRSNSESNSQQSDQTQPSDSSQQDPMGSSNSQQSSNNQSSDSQQSSNQSSNKQQDSQAPGQEQQPSEQSSQSSSDSESQSEQSPMEQSDSNQPGQSESDQQQPGQSQSSQNQSDQSQPGQSQSEGGKQPGDSNQPGQSQPGQPSDQLSEGGQQGTSSGGGGTGADPREPNYNKPGDDSPQPITPEEADLESRKKATELALKRLRDRMARGETPEELLENTNFTESELDSFLQRLEDRLSDPGIDNSPQSEAQRRQFESLLKGIDYKSTGARRDGNNTNSESATGFGASNLPVPPEFRQEEKSYKSKLSRQGTNRQ